MRTLRIGMAQINCIVGDLEGNCAKIRDYIDKAEQNETDLIAFPELAITGYPPEDLLLKKQFVTDNLACLDRLAAYTSSKKSVAVIGFVDRDINIHNAAAVIHDGKIAGRYRKILLPNYGVFDEKRYFEPGDEYPVFEFDGVPIGLNICEDIWSPEGPALIQASCGGARLIVNINASPYHAGKGLDREKMLKTRAVDNRTAVVYVNMVGGQDELVFDGHSLVIDPSGAVIARGKQFEEDLVIIDIDIDEMPAATAPLADPVDLREQVSRTAIGKSFGNKPADIRPPLPRLLGEDEEIYRALVLGVGDYVVKNGFKKAVIGLSGGIDSALTAAVAADSVGSGNVIGVFMPSQFSSTGSREDSFHLAENLGVEILEIPITGTFECYREMMAGSFAGRLPDIAEENIQARIRGNILMALSNKFGYLVLSTGNKSEMSVGYATLYGDMSGGFAVLKDVMKTTVYKLARFYNRKEGRAAIPERIIAKAPSAELRPDQKDSDTLPPYEILDPILKAYIEEDKSVKEIAALGFETDLVKKVVLMVDRSEYKRRQAPPGVKISVRAFGKDRRLPITNGYRG